MHRCLLVGDGRHGHLGSVSFLWKIWQFQVFKKFIKTGLLYFPLTFELGDRVILLKWSISVSTALGFLDTGCKDNFLFSFHWSDLTLKIRLVYMFHLPFVCGPHNALVCKYCRAHGIVEWGLLWAQRTQVHRRESLEGYSQRSALPPSPPSGWGYPCCCCLCWGGLCTVSTRLPQSAPAQPGWASWKPELCPLHHLGVFCFIIKTYI